MLSGLEIPVPGDHAHGESRFAHVCGELLRDEALAIARLGAQHIDDVGALRPEVVEYGIAQVAGGGLLVGARIAACPQRARAGEGSQHAAAGDAFGADLVPEGAVEQLEQDEESEDEEKRPQECRDHHELAFARLGAERQHGRVDDLQGCGGHLQALLFEPRRVEGVQDREVILLEELDVALLAVERRTDGGEEFVLAVELLFLRFHHLQLGARLLEQEHGVEPLRNHRGGRKALLGVLLERDVGGDLLQVAAEGVEFKLEPVRLCPSGGLHLRQTVALEGFGRGDLVMAVRNLVEFLQEEGVVAERLERLDFLFDGFDLLARAVVVEQDVLQFELIVAREGRDVAGLLVVVDDVVATLYCVRESSWSWSSLLTRASSFSKTPAP